MRGASRLVALVATVLAASALIGRAADPISVADAELQYQLGNLLFQDTRYQEALVAFAKAAKAEDRSLSLRARKGTVRTALVVAEFDTARREAESLRRDVPGD